MEFQPFYHQSIARLPPPPSRPERERSDGALAAALRLTLPEQAGALQSAALQAMMLRLPLADQLRAEGLVDEGELLAALAAVSALPLLPEGPLHACPVALALTGAPFWTARNILPLAFDGRRLTLAVARPGAAADLRALPALRDLDLRLHLCAPERIRAALIRAAAPELTQAAEQRLPAALSVRCLSTGWPKALRRGLLCGAAGLVLLWPLAIFTLIMGWLILTLTASGLLRVFALGHALLHRPALSAAPAALPPEPPVITLLVPLYNEPDIAARLVQRLGQLDYPRACLQVLLILEEKDEITRAALAPERLPGWISPLIVPPGAVTTKPRAMNFALPFARGSLIGIYDAEDAPEPDQLRQVAARFHKAGADLACLQGALDYYNPRTNLIARLFTAEYAAWFRVVLPALQRLRFPMPLGGTTLFIRRTVLEQLGAWDAHNVTEDADLGIRIARAGLRTEMLASTTHEEANCRPSPWLRQRSRWIKGHLLTWATHMQDPRALWRDLGPRGFLGYQIVFLGAQSQVLLASLNWSFWLLLAGLPHPARDLASEGLLLALAGLYLLSELLLISCAALALGRMRHRGLWPVTLLFQLYHLLASCAGWRALTEAFHKPFYWAKTSHGHFDGDLSFIAGGDAAHRPQGADLRPPPIEASPLPPGPGAAARPALFRPARSATRIRHLFAGKSISGA